MSRPWVRFLASLEMNGLTFEDVQLASDRHAVIAATGITDPLTVAILETEWQRRIGSNTSAAVPSSSSTAASPTPTPRSFEHGPAPGASSGGAVLRTPRGPHPYNLGALADPLGLSSGSGDLVSLKDPHELKQLPEELQDVLLTREVLNAALGLGGQWIYQQDTTAPSGYSGCTMGFIISSAVPLSLRGLCETVLPVADAFTALRRVEDAEFLGKSLVAMALGEVVSEICTAYSLEVSKLQQWSRDDPFGRVMPLMRVIADITRIGHPLVRLRQILPVELVNFAGAAVDPVLCGPSTAAQDGGPNPTTSLVNASQQAFLSGPRLLNHLNEQLERCGGSREEGDVLQLLLRRALVPYLAMLRRWMHEGVLEDPFGEFFITDNTAGGAGAGFLHDSFAAVRASKHITELFPELTAGQEQFAASPYRYYFGAQGGSALISTQQQQATAFERRFSMNKLLMPSFVERPSRIAKMVFFTGKYCCLLRECHEQLPDFGATTMVSSNTVAVTNGEDEAQPGGLAHSTPCFVWQGVEDLHEKIQRSFELASQTVIQLLFSPKVDLLGHLTSIKLFYLHSQGDWITDFLDNADDLLRKSREKVKGYSLRVLLQGSIARCCSSQDPYHDMVGCSFSDVTLEQHLQRWRRKGKAEKGAVPPLEEAGAAPSPLNEELDGRLSAGTKSRVEVQRCIELLQLEADLKWPLTLILDPTVMARFNSIFRLLTWIKVCERSLCVLWHTNEILASFPVAYGIKHHFIQFLRQFQFFAAHFILEPQWSRLVSRLGPSDSLFAISQALNEFFTEVERGLTLSSSTRFKSLSNVLLLVARFCEVGRHSSTATLPLIEATLHSIEDQYLTTLSELASAVGPDYPQLVPLLTCIDFNGFYDAHNIYHVQSGY